jgi:methyltransferase
MSFGLPQIVVLLVAAQRLAELVYVRRNTARLLAAGAFEVGAGHYPLFILLHGGWLIAMLAFIPADAPVSWFGLGVYAVLQLGRLWVVRSLGGRWTTRIIVYPNTPLNRRGPYRLMRHPNYAIVAAEVMVLPLAFSAWEIAVAFSVANLALLAWRIRIEDQALAGLH